MYACHFGVGFWESLRPHWFKEGLRGGNDTWEKAETGCCEGLGVFSDAGLADDGEEGDDVEAPTWKILTAVWEPLLKVSYSVKVSSEGIRGKYIPSKRSRGSILIQRQRKAGHGDDAVQNNV